MATRTDQILACRADKPRGSGRSAFSLPRDGQDPAARRDGVWPRPGP